MRRNSSFKKHFKEKNNEHYLLTCDLVEYNFKEVRRTFNISYFTKNKDLCKEFINSENLKYYESIEKHTNDLILIFVRKFKLRLSFKKSNNFSKEIIISDDYSFNPDSLHHADSLIKIAIVKDNYEKWNSSNLNYYDYIFTLDKHKLESSKKIFPLKGETTFEYIKYILNELFRRKLDKFYYFLKDSSFQEVFPKKTNYFKVLNSEYFDDDWYRETYGLSENTDSIIHFLLVGNNRGYNPGPNFNTNEYYECNMDVKLSRVNALVHYESYGKKESRIINVSDIKKRNYDLISNSPYFDKEWYRSTFEIGDVDPVEHYLDIGYSLWYNPGPNFSNFEYYESNNDIRRMQVNQLLHYELYGRRENRRITLYDDKYEQHRLALLNSPYFDKEWYRSTYDIGDADPLEHYWKIGYAKGYDPGPNFSTNEYNECNEDVRDHGLNPLVHYEVYGRRENRKLRHSD